MDKKIINFLTQWSVIIPLALILCVWLLWPQKKGAIIQAQKSSTDKKITPTLKPSISLMSLYGSKKKLHCTITGAVAVIDDTKIAATITQDKKKNQIVFDGDCLYRWTQGSNNGERSCGLKSYIPFIAQLTGNGQVEKIFPQANALASACKNVPEIDQVVFEVPKTVLFKNKKLL